MRCAPVQHRTDHNGKVFATITEMCKYYGIPVKTYRSRVFQQGMSVKDALTIKEVKYQNAVKDHLGNEFRTYRDMFNYYGITDGTFRHRIKSGRTLAEALTGDFEKYKDGHNTTGIKCKDHLGNKFSSKLELCSYYGIDNGTLDTRLNNGMSLEEALTTPVRKVASCKDHLGNEYKSVSEMCRRYNINKGTFNNRIRKGLSLEEALTYKVDSDRAVAKECFDHLGSKYKSKSEMCKDYKISFNAFTQRMKSGWSLKEALLTPVKHQYMNGWKILYSVFEYNGELYYMCIKGEQEEVLTMEEIKSS